MESAEGTRGRHTTRGRVWRYGPVAAWVAVIYFASTANLSASNTSLIIRPLLLWLFPDITPEGLTQAHFLVRKAAHLTEYAILALLAARALLSSSNAGRRRYWHVCAFSLVASTALLDEYHQSFLQSRTGTIYDSLIDMTGGALALLAVGAWRRRAERSKGEAGEAQTGRGLAGD